MGKKKGGLSLPKLIGLGLIAAAVAKELRTPAEERTWHGDLGGFVPYDFRVPTFSRLKDAWWDTSSDKLFQPKPFGVGWSVNLPVAIDLGKKAASGLADIAKA